MAARIGHTLYPGEGRAVEGVMLASAAAGIRYPQRQDLALLRLAPGTVQSGMFTQNAFSAAPVQVARRHLDAASSSKAIFWLINSGNANAGTGAAGEQAARDCCAAVSALVQGEATQVLPFSTGVIGELLPVQKIQAAVGELNDRLQADAWPAAAQAIMTTDTRPKLASVELLLPGGMVTITGMAKGAGMICPNMATMLAFISTNAEVEQSLLDQILKAAVEKSFNRITVDGDTSTNDACMLAATACGPEISLAHPEEYQAFADAVESLLAHLAMEIIRDAEGATKFVTIEVESAATAQEAMSVAYTLAHSPLVKTALFASDPNWGRILAAVGRSQVPDLAVEQVDIWLNDVCIVAAGARAASYTEEQGVRVMAETDVTIRVVLHRGEVCERVWTSDLSHDYVRINAEYRT